MISAHYSEVRSGWIGFVSNRKPVCAQDGKIAVYPSEDAALAAAKDPPEVRVTAKPKAPGAKKGEF